jgi:hypothetical protein
MSPVHANIPTLWKRDGKPYTVKWRSSAGAIARDRDALALAARELIDALVCVRRHIDLVEHGRDAHVDLAGRRVRWQP